MTTNWIYHSVKLNEHYFVDLKKKKRKKLCWCSQLCTVFLEQLQDPTEYLPRKELLGQTHTIPQCFSCCQIAIYSDFIKWHSHPALVGGGDWLAHFLASFDCQTLIFANLADVKWHLIVVLFYVSLMTREVGCLFVCWWLIHFPSSIE